MLEKCTDFGNKTKHLISGNENAYIDSIHQKHNILIRESCFEKGALRQFHLRLWIDSGSLTEEQAAFVKPATSGQYRYTPCADIPPGDEGDALCFRLVTEYLNCFSVNCTEADEIYLYIYDFKAYLTEYAYGHAIREIKSRVSQKFGINPKDVFVINEPVVKILVWEQDCYTRLSSLHASIAHECYEVLKKYDPYNCILEDNISVRILLGSEMDNNLLNTMLILKE